MQEINFALTLREELQGGLFGLHTQFIYPPQNLAETTSLFQYKLFPCTKTKKKKTPEELNYLLKKHYLSVVQHFSLGGVGFKAQDSFSFVKLIFNSPRIHLFMATCGRGGIDLDPINSLTLPLPKRFPVKGGFHQKQTMEGWRCCGTEATILVPPSKAARKFRIQVCLWMYMEQTYYQTVLLNTKLENEHTHTHVNCVSHCNISARIYVKI